MRKPARDKILAALEERGFRMSRVIHSPAGGDFTLQFWVGALGVRIVQLWKDGGIEVYRPVTDSNRVDATIEALS